MITLHHLNHSRSQRILWLLEELELDYKLVKYQRDSKTMLAPSSLKDAHPLGKSPTLEDDNLVVIESGAIIEYIAESYAPQLIPDSKKHRTEARTWLHYAEGSIMPLLLIKLVLQRVTSAKMPFFAKPIAKKIVDSVHEQFLDAQLKTHLQYIAQTLRGRNFFVNDQLSIADFSMIFPLEAIASTGINLVDDENSRIIHNYVSHIQKREAYQRGIEKGGPYNYLLD